MTGEDEGGRARGTEVEIFGGILKGSLDPLSGALPTFAPRRKPVPARHERKQIH